MSKYVLALSRSVVLDANGRGSVSVGPAKYSERWTVNRFTTSGNSATEPDLRIYRGAGGSSLLDTSARGNADVSETDLNVRSGEHITALYTGGTAGAVMTLYVEGVLRYGI